MIALFCSCDNGTEIAENAQADTETLTRFEEPPKTVERFDVAPRLARGSHLRVFVPTLPYIVISHAISRGLLKPADNGIGYDYDLAVAMKQLDDLTYEFELRRGVRFQDGSPFNADSVVKNMEQFTKQPFTFTRVHETFDRATKIGPYRVRLHLKEKYGQFLNDLVWMHFYTDAYLKKFGWNGKPTCPSLAEAGPYSIGPYILREGYIEGDRKTSKAVLEANPYFYEPGFPRVQKITVYTELDSDEALEMALETNGKLDYMRVPFSSKIDVIMSENARLITAPSNDNLAIHFNLISGNSKLRDREIRTALNAAISQANLVRDSFDGEAIPKPTLASPSFPGVGPVVEKLRPISEVRDPRNREIRAALKDKLDGLKLRVISQAHFQFLWEALAKQLSFVGVKLEIEYVLSETDVFQNLLNTKAGGNNQEWDLLIWGDADWYFNHPWAAFLVYWTVPGNPWSTLQPDSVMAGHIGDLFAARAGTDEYHQAVEAIMRRASDQAYMLFTPAPNKVLALNKQVRFTPRKSAVLPLWEMEVSRSHWSVR